MENTVGHSLLTGAGLSVAGLVIVIAVAFGLTTLFNVVRVERTDARADPGVLR
jgi:threonine/homoserine/homoserine lactone efflux protein